MSGDIALDLQGSSGLAATYEPIGVMDMAYAFDDVEHLFSWFDESEAAQQMRDDFEAETGAIEFYNEIVEYLKGIAPELVERVNLYEEPVPLFDKADVETEIRDLFKRRCDLPSGGYLIIEPTEALVSIDVNSGRYTGKKDPEKTILRTNLEAAREIARQIRLRDIGGIIVCDFIDGIGTSMSL